MAQYSNDQLNDDQKIQIIQQIGDITIAAEQMGISVAEATRLATKTTICVPCQQK